MLLDPVSLLSRAIHILSAISLLGGVIYARFAVYPDLSEQQAARSRPLILGSVIGLLATGLYNLITKTSIPPGYHMIFGIKMLLALHIFAVGFLLTKPGVDPAKRARWMTGIVGSGVVIVLLSAYLRSISLPI
jgi:uncharacterized membrane protein